MKENKKMLIVVIVLAIIAILVTILAITENEKQKRILENFNNYFNSETNELIYFAKEGCYYCQLMDGAKKELLDDTSVDYFFVDTSKVSTGTLDKMLDKLGITKFGTPTLVIVKDGKVVKEQSGVFTESDNKNELEAFLKEYSIIEGS